MTTTNKRKSLFTLEEDKLELPETVITEPVVGETEGAGDTVEVAETNPVGDTEEVVEVNPVNNDGTETEVIVDGDVDPDLQIDDTTVEDPMLATESENTSTDDDGDDGEGEGDGETDSSSDGETDTTTESSTGESGEASADDAEYEEPTGDEDLSVNDTDDDTTTDDTTTEDTADNDDTEYGEEEDIDNDSSETSSESIHRCVKQTIALLDYRHCFKVEGSKFSPALVDYGFKKNIWQNTGLPNLESWRQYGDGNLGLESSFRSVSAEAALTSKLKEKVATLRDKVLRKTKGDVEKLNSEINKQDEKLAKLNGATVDEEKVSTCASSKVFWASVVGITAVVSAVVACAVIPKALASNNPNAVQQAIKTVVTKIRGIKFPGKTQPIKLIESGNNVPKVSKAKGFSLTTVLKDGTSETLGKKGFNKGFIKRVYDTLKSALTDLKNVIKGWFTSIVNCFKKASVATESIGSAIAAKAVTGAVIGAGAGAMVYGAHKGVFGEKVQKLIATSFLLRFLVGFTILLCGGIIAAIVALIFNSKGAKLNPHTKTK